MAETASIACGVQFIKDAKLYTGHDLIRYLHLPLGPEGPPPLVNGRPGVEATEASFTFGDLVDWHMSFAWWEWVKDGLEDRVDLDPGLFRDNPPLRYRDVITSGCEAAASAAARDWKWGGTSPAIAKLTSLLTTAFSRVEFDDEGKPIRLYPLTRGWDRASPRLIAIDPRYRFGEPCIADKGVSVEILAERFRAGESIADLVTDYGLTIAEVEEALRYASCSSG